MSMLTTVAIAAQGQHSLELVQDGVNNSYQPPVPKGPTSIPQSVVFFLNKDGSTDTGLYFQKPADAISATFSFDDQQFLTVPQHVTGLTFGAASGASSGHMKSVPVFNTNYSFTDTTRTMFTAHPAGAKGKGLDLYVNGGIQIFLSAKPLFLANMPKTDTSRFYYGKLKVQFSKPVTDPVLTFVGLGATTNFGNKRLGFATELELQNNAVQLVKLSGNTDMLVENGKILHAKTPITGNCGAGAGCGSVVLKGSNIENVTFAVYLRADGGPGVWATEKVTNSGDMWHITLSLPEQH